MLVTTLQHLRRYTIGLIQMSVTPDPADNLRRAVEQVRTAAKKGAKVICLPELFRSQCFCQCEDSAHFDLAEPVPGPSTEAMATAARLLGAVGYPF